MDQLAMANSVHWYGHVLRREGGHELRSALDLKVECQWKKASQGGHGGSRLRKKVRMLV